jgi:hypothetical protein
LNQGCVSKSGWCALTEAENPCHVIMLKSDAAFILVASIICTEIAHVDGLDPATGDYRTLNALLPSSHAAKGDSE